MIILNKLKGIGVEKILLSVIILLRYITFVNGQIPPSIDYNWELNLVKSDEFNDTMFDTSKWDKLNPAMGIGYNWGGGQIFIPSHVLVDGKYLILKAERSLSSNKYLSGGIQSVDHNYSYGYFEISAKLPGYYRNELPCGKGFWPAFWTYYQEKESNCVTIHDEIDILEPSGSQYAEANVNVCGWHDEIGSCKTSKEGR